jgi:hypothetical protein
MLQAELSDDYFGLIDQHLKRLKFSGGVLVSAQLGKGNKGTNYALRRPHRERGWLARLLPHSEGYTYHLHPRDEAGAQALGTLRDRGVNLVANAMAQSMDHISSFFQMLRTELAFYVACPEPVRAPARAWPSGLLSRSDRPGATGPVICRSV